MRYNRHSRIAYWVGGLVVIGCLLALPCAQWWRTPIRIEEKHEDLPVSVRIEIDALMDHIAQHGPVDIYYMSRYMAHYGSSGLLYAISKKGICHEAKLTLTLTIGSFVSVIESQHDVDTCVDFLLEMTRKPDNLSRELAFERLSLFVPKCRLTYEECASYLAPEWSPSAQLALFSLMLRYKERLPSTLQTIEQYLVDGTYGPYELSFPLIQADDRSFHILHSLLDSTSRYRHLLAAEYVSRYLGPGDDDRIEEIEKAVLRLRALADDDINRIIDPDE